MSSTNHSMEVVYLGELRNQATHLASSNTLITDAPLDNQGRGEAFSPTDLLCTSLATCMMTIMGIAARERDINLKDSSVRITKVMAAQPRRVSEIRLHFTLVSSDLNDHQLQVLKQAAHTCPVALSIHPDIHLEVTFEVLERSE